MTKQLLYKILGIIAGIVFIVGGISANHHLSRLKRFGTSAEVIPPDSYTDHNHNGSHTFTGQIKFKLADGSEMSRNHSIPEKALDSMKAGQPVTVFYDSTDPSDFVFAQEESEYWLPLLGVGFIIGAFFIGRK